jgi:hypothetical protein
MNLMGPWDQPDVAVFLPIPQHGAKRSPGFHDSPLATNRSLKDHECMARRDLDAIG